MCCHPQLSTAPAQPATNSTYTQVRGFHPFQGLQPSACQGEEGALTVTRVSSRTRFISGAFLSPASLKRSWIACGSATPEFSSTSLEVDR